MSLDRDKLRLLAESFGFRTPDSDELKAALHLAETLTRLKLGSRLQAGRVQAKSGCSLWVWGRPITGFYYVIPLTQVGNEAVIAGTFDPLMPLLEHVAGPGDPFGGVYVGVYAGETHDARKAVMMSSAFARVQVFPHVACYARAATDDGARSMVSLGFYPLEGSLPDLWTQAPLTSQAPEIRFEGAA